MPGPVPMQVGAVLVLGPSHAAGSAAVAEAIERRSRAIPRLRQVLVDAPVGCGRPLLGRRRGLRHRAPRPDGRLPEPGDEAALLALAADSSIERLPDDRPLWSVTLVTGLADGGSALVTVFHHVLADGIGGLAVLAGLVDGAAEDLPVPAPSPRPHPEPGSWSTPPGPACGRWPICPPVSVGSGQAIGELRRADTPKRARTSLNRPTGPSGPWPWPGSTWRRCSTSPTGTAPRSTTSCSPPWPVRSRPRWRRRGERPRCRSS